MIDKNDYEGHLMRGKEYEDNFVKAVKCFGWDINRNDKNNPSNVDFSFTMKFDLKVRRVPFRKALDFVSLPAHEAVPINLNKLEKYKDQNASILFDVDYAPEFGTLGLYMISVRKILKLKDMYPHRIHWYQTRKDDPKNAKSSFYISTQEMVSLPIWFERVYRTIERGDK